jgi:protein-S-isoprenylcysteine O-methyltransferase Ste14
MRVKKFRPRLVVGKSEMPLSGMDLTALNGVAALLVTLSWPVYLALFIRRRPSHSKGRRDPLSLVGIGLQFTGVLFAWWHRPLFSSLIPVFPANVIAPVVAVVIAAGSVWFSHIALKALGPQWSFLAEVQEGHRLVQDGLYGVVRHPLYLSFFGLTVATGIVWAEPLPLMIGIALFLCGVWIRVRVEERLLKEKFGAEFEAYARRVPAFFPRSFGWTHNGRVF